MGRKKATAVEVAKPAAHSSIVGGSNAGMRLACPGSYQMQGKLPGGPKGKSSTFADEGTALHGAMAYMINNDVLDAQEVLGMEFAGHDDDDGAPGEPYVMTQELVTDALTPALAYFDKLIDGEEMDDATEWKIELRCQLPGIPDAFGTTDLLIFVPSIRTTKIVDWKFGVGVPVRAFYIGVDEEGEYEMPNPQPMFYARAAMHDHPEMFGGELGGSFASIPDDWKIELHIAQPRCRVRDTLTDEEAEAERYTSITVTKKELEEFRTALIRAIAEAVGDNPRIARGDHCRFASCKTICPKFTQPMMDIGRLAALAQRAETDTTVQLPAPGVMLSYMLDFGDMIEEFLKEVRAQAHAYIENGNTVPYWKIVPKRGQRSYDAPEEVIVEVVENELLRHPGSADADPQTVLYTEPELRSPKQLEDRLKTFGIKSLPTFKDIDGSDRPIASMKPGKGTTLARESDERDAAVPRALIVEKFAKLIEHHK